MLLFRQAAQKVRHTTACYESTGSWLASACNIDTLVSPGPLWLQHTPHTSDLSRKVVRDQRVNSEGPSERRLQESHVLHMPVSQKELR